MERDLFSIFPDLPRPRMAPLAAEAPLSSRIGTLPAVQAVRSPTSLRRRVPSASARARIQFAALQTIREIARRESARKTPRRRVLESIVQTADAALFD